MAKAAKKTAEDDFGDNTVDFSGDGEGGGGMIDLSGVDADQQYPVLRPGIYDCVITGVEYTLSQASGNPMWSMQLEVTEGDFAGEKLFTHLVFVDKALPRVKRTLARIKPELLEAAFDPEQVAAEGTLDGTECRAKVDNRVYEGQKRNNVKDILAPASSGDDFASG